MESPTQFLVGRSNEHGLFCFSSIHQPVCAKPTYLVLARRLYGVQFSGGDGIAHLKGACGQPEDLANKVCFTSHQSVRAKPARTSYGGLFTSGNRIDHTIPRERSRPDAWHASTNHVTITGASEKLKLSDLSHLPKFTFHSSWPGARHLSLPWVKPRVTRLTNESDVLISRTRYPSCRHQSRLAEVSNHVCRFL